MLKNFTSSFIVWLVIFATPGRTNDYQVLERVFDARILTFEEKRFLQAGLAFEGLYQGLLDGKWGRISQRALEQYSRRETDSSASNIHMALLALGLWELMERDGWNSRYFGSHNVSFLFPFKTAIEDPRSGRFANWRHMGSSLGISVGTADLGESQGFHDFALSKNDPSKDPYIVRRPGFSVTSTVSRDGSILYVRSDYTRGTWTTVMLSAEAQDGNLLNALAGSITIGQAPQLDFPEHGLLAQVILLTIAWAAEYEDAPAENRAASGIGSGFVVSRNGHLLTNAHVVEGCASIDVGGFKATLLAVSTDFDLALLQSLRLSGGTSATFAQQPAPLNSNITVAGYPLSGLLEGLNVTRGAVSGLKGLGGSELTIQISAPVQKGNSGGPVLADDGTVVGVVVSKLDAAAIAEETGDIPQNVNFAVPGELAKLFLFRNGISPTIGSRVIRPNPVELAKLANSYTYPVECFY